MTEWTSNCYLRETHLTTEDKHRVSVKTERQSYQQMATKKMSGKALPIADLIDFQIKMVIEVYYIMIKGSIH